MKPNQMTILFLFIIFFPVIIGCSGEKKMEKIDVSYKSLKVVQNDRWEELSKKRIYFGHQSVGYNIIDGIRALMSENKNIKLNLIEYNNKQKLSDAFFAHSRVGQNRNPKTKNNDFKKIINKELKDSVDIAFFKYCYVDIDSRTDIEEVFTDYQKMMSELKRKFPDIIFVHLTVPLTSSSPSKLKAFIKRMLGRLNSEESNRIRNQYNDRLRKTYEGKEPIFDLARVESTLPDGTRTTFDFKGSSYFKLASIYTSDGGHLNEAGQKRIAEELILFLLKQI